MESNCACNSTNAFVIFTGQDKTMNLQSVTPLQSGFIPLDLTSCTQINVALPNADGTFTSLLLTDSQISIVSPANLGQIQVPITHTVSALLNVGELQNIDVAYTISGEITIVRFFQALTVIEAN